MTAQIVQALTTLVLGIVAGYMVAWAERDAYYIDNIAVDPAHQGRGAAGDGGTEGRPGPDEVAGAAGNGAVRLCVGPGGALKAGSHDFS